MPGSTCAYCFNVKAGDSWPSRSLITFTGTPARSAIVAWVCRRSWSRIFGNAVFAIARSKAAALCARGDEGSLTRERVRFEYLVS
jgi:hypothetical protein